MKTALYSLSIIALILAALIGQFAPKNDYALACWEIASNERGIGCYVAINPNLAEPDSQWLNISLTNRAFRITLGFEG